MSTSRIAYASSVPAPDYATARDGTVSWKPAAPGWLRRLSSPLRVLPDFLIIGAQKAGTSSLYSYLVSHPDVWGPACKECHFFTRARRSMQYYRAYFPPVWRARALRRIGEATPYYLAHPAVPERVARLLPQARLIVLLRDPVERAWSHYRHNRRHGLETLDFEAALDAEAERTAGESERLERDPRATSRAHREHSYVERGMYAAQLRRWLAHFDRSRLLVLLAEDLFRDPRRATRTAERFLALAEGPEQSFAPRNVDPASSGMPPAARRRLAGAFAPANADLERLLGIETRWQGG